MDTTSPPDIRAFLDRYAAALVGGDLPGIAGCYALPALVVGDSNTVPVAETGQIEAAFAGAADGYRAQGLVGARPELRAVDPLTAALTLVDVRWAYLDADGRERQHSEYRYLLRRTGPGELAIQVVVDTTAAPGQPEARPATAEPGPATG
jgi:ketosteroid isomerase-like protein